MNLNQTTRRTITRKKRTIKKEYVKSWSEEIYDRFLKEGAILFKYMVDNFEDMIDGEIIKHFTITDIRRKDFDDVIDNIISNYNYNIQNELIHWIRTEYYNGEFCSETNWKPFRDWDMMTSMCLGYKKMFNYKQYYFQVVIDMYCGDCIYCKNEESRIHFELNLYGWKDELYDNLQPDNIVVIPQDNSMPNVYWNTK